MFFFIFTPWPSTKILADPGLEPALAETISFTFPALTTMPFVLGSNGPDQSACYAVISF